MMDVGMKKGPLPVREGVRNCPPRRVKVRNFHFNRFIFAVSHFRSFALPD